MANQPNSPISAVSHSPAGGSAKGKEFDPYAVWFEIPPAEQPADYYRLLGVARFEPDRSKISAASEARIGRLANARRSENADAAQRLAAEVRRATSCLLNPHRKRLYDEFLKSGGQAVRAERAAQPEVEQSGPMPKPDPSGTDNDLNVAFNSVPPPIPRHRRRRSRFPLASVLVCLGGLAATAALVALVVSMSDPGPAPVPTGVPTLAARAGDTEVPPVVENDGSEPASDVNAPVNSPVRVEAPSDESRFADLATLPDDADSTSDEFATAPEVKPLSFPSSDPRPKALRFRGADHVTLTESRGLVDLAEPFTVELWARFEKGTYAHWILGDLVFGSSHSAVPNGAVAGWQFWIMESAGDQRSIGVSTRKGFGARFTDKGMAWHHFAVCGDEKKFSIYVDGRLLASQPAELLLDGYKPSPIALHVGGHGYLNPNQPPGFQGALRGLRVSSVCRYRENFSPPDRFDVDDGTRVAWDFVHAAAGEVRDLTDAAHNGRLFGAEWFIVDSDATSGLATTSAPGGGESPSEMPAKRIPVPTKDALRAARERVDRLFKSEVAAAKQPEQRAEVAKKLRKLIGSTDSDPAASYVMLDLAFELAASADLTLALQVIDDMAERFEIDVMARQASAFQEASTSLRGLEDRKRLAAAALDAARRMKGEGRYDIASSTTQVAIFAATRARLAEIGKESRQLRDEINRAERRASAAEEARMKLAADPMDPPSNLAYGEYLCFERGDWEHGALCLSRSNSSLLREAALLELSKPGTGEEMASAAAAWDKAHDEVDRDDREVLLRRVLYWSQLAAAKLDGLAKAEVDRRVAELQALLPSAASEPVSSRSPIPSSQLPPVPPKESRGMLGRLQMGGRDLGILWRYEAGLRLTNANVVRILEQASVPRGAVRMEFVGLLYVPEAMTVSVAQMGGTAEKGKAVVFVNRRPLGDVGRGEPTSDVYNVELAAGEHSIGWIVEGADIGDCSLRFTNAASGEVLHAYHSQSLLSATRETPFRARLNVNMVQ